MRTETEWRTWMFSVARRRTCCDADAEDIVQDVLLRFWGSFGVLPWEHTESQWARVVCQRWIRFRAAEFGRSACVRHECALSELVQVPLSCGEGSETHLVEHTDHQLLLQDITHVLSPQQWQMLQLHLEGYTYEEIAKQLGICCGTVKRQFARIREKMQPVLSTFWGCESELMDGGTNRDDGYPNFAEEENAGGGDKVAPQRLYGVIRRAHYGILALAITASLSALAEAQHDTQIVQMVHEVLSAAALNGTLTRIAEKGVEVSAGLHMSSIPADGESLIWGVIELKDADGKPIPEAVVELNTTAGIVHWLDNTPTTDAEGRFVFAVQSSLQPTSFRVRFNFPQFGVGGTLPGSFCRIGEPGCVLPSRCGSISAAWEYNPIQDNPNSRICTTTVACAYTFYASDSPEPPTIYFDYVTYKNSRPEGAFPERRLHMSYTECHNYYEHYYGDFCRCLRGLKEGVSDLTYGWSYTFGGFDRGLPNGENVAEVTYLQYQAGSPGRVCKKEFRFDASSPLVRLSREWIIFEDVNSRPTVEVEIISPHWQGNMWLTLEYGHERSLHQVQVPGRYTISLNRTPYGSTRVDTPYQVRASLRAIPLSYYYPNDSDTTSSYVRADGFILQPLGYNPRSRTFDFSVRYRLSCTIPHLRTPLVSQGYIAVYYGNDLNHQIHAENLSYEHCTEGTHTVIVRIPENQMTRFGTYRFIPYFTDNFAGYYRDELPRRVVVDSAPSFTTPTISEVNMVYSLRGMPVLNNTTQARLMYPYAGDEVDIVALINPGAYTYGPVPRTSVYIDEARWDGNAESGWRGETRPDTNFFDRPSRHFVRIERNGMLSEDEAGHKLWPGPKLEFRWVEITHHTGETEDRTYWYTMREIASGSPVYSLRARRGTKRYAVAITNPHWDYYLVGGIGRIPKNQWSQYVNGDTQINRARARAAARISARERITGSDTNYRLRLLEWATAFIGVKYDWGGSWFGGRVHPTVSDGNYYNGFGLDCSKLVSVTAMLAGMRWWDSQRYRNKLVRWWDVGTVHIREEALPLTQRWDSATEARNQVSPGDVIISTRHVAYLYSIVRQNTEFNRQGVVTRRYVWELEVIDASGGDDPELPGIQGYNEVRISNGTHLIGSRLRSRVSASERDYNGARRMSEWTDMLRALEKRGYTFRRIRETNN